MFYGILLAIIIYFILWVIVIVDCRIIAGQLNRDKDGWTILGFFFPLPALIILGLILKPKPPKKEKEK